MTVSRTRGRTAFTLVAAAAALTTGAIAPASAAGPAPAQTATTSTGIAIPASKFLDGGPGAKAQPGSFIVSLGQTPSLTKEAAKGGGSGGDPKKAEVRKLARELVAKYGGTAGSVFAYSFRGFELKATAKIARAIAKDPLVAYVEKDLVVTTTDTRQTDATWGLDRLDQKNPPLDGSYTYGTNGSGVSAYIVDTGLRPTHVEFGGRATSAFNSVGDGRPDDCNGHGTHVAGTVGGTQFGVAKGVRLVGVKVLDCNGDGTLGSLLGGLDWVAANAVRPAVANLSLGAVGTSASLESAVDRLVQAGIPTVAAAGNEAIDACGVTPARTPSAITVGASDRDDLQASFSNFGTCVDLYAPGVDITSAWFTGDDRGAILSGTSQAAPHVAGVVATYLSENASLTPAQVAERLTNTSAGFRLSGLGAGSPNRLLQNSVAAPGCLKAGPGNIAIPDAPGGPITSRVTVNSCGSVTASARATVRVRINHTYIGDLVIDLVAADGSVYRLKGASSDSTDNLDATYTVDLSSEPAAAGWTLRVQDVYRADRGTLVDWTLGV